MAIELLGVNTGVVHFLKCRWWAEHGMIHSERLSDGKFETHRVSDILKRLKALNDMVGNSRSDVGLAKYGDEVEDYRRGIEELIQLCRKAQDQGRPDDPRAVKQILSDRRITPRMVVMPGLYTQL